MASYYASLWEAEYAGATGAGTREWVRSWRELEPLLRPYLRRESRVLEVGCGSSELAIELVRSGLCDAVTASDISPSCVELMRQRVAALGLSQPVYVLDDMLSSSLPAEGFDVVLDKCTMDALMGEDDKLAFMTAVDRWLPSGCAVRASPTPQVDCLADGDPRDGFACQFFFACRKPPAGDSPASTPTVRWQLRPELFETPFSPSPLAQDILAREHLFDDPSTSDALLGAASLFAHDSSDDDAGV